MDLQTIEVIAVKNETKLNSTGKSYNMVTVTYRDDKGKVSEKKVMGFGATAPACQVLSSATSGQTYELETVKNGEYRNWVKATLSQGNPAQGGVQPVGGSARAATSSQARTTYETPEERARKQVLIIRQSAVGYSTDFLKHNKKNFTEEEMFQLAERIVDFVNQSGPKVPVPQAVPDDFESDIPY